MFKSVGIFFLVTWSKLRLLGQGKKETLLPTITHLSQSYIPSEFPSVVKTFVSNFLFLRVTVEFETNYPTYIILHGHCVRLRYDTKSFGFTFLLYLSV